MTLEAACEAYGGAHYVTGILVNRCDKTYPTLDDAEADSNNFTTALRPSCQGDAYLGTGLGGLDLTSRFQCLSAASMQMMALLARGARRSGSYGADIVS